MRSRPLRLAFVLGTLCAVENAALADPPAPAYIVPGQLPPKPAHKAPQHAPRAARSTDGRAVVTLPGFKILENGGTRVYVELSSSVAVEEHRSGATITYKLKQARVPLRNNRNALVTSHFNTPVASARLVQSGHDVHLVIVLRAASTPTERVVAGEGGTARVEVDFPAGNFVVPTASEDAPQTPDQAKPRAPSPAANAPSGPAGPPAP